MLTTVTLYRTFVLLDPLGSLSPQATGALDPLDPVGSNHVTSPKSLLGVLCPIP